jgi:hypothetical protein
MALKVGYYNDDNMLITELIAAMRKELLICHTQMNGIDDLGGGFS